MSQEQPAPPFETPFSASPSLEDLRKMVTNFATERDWHQYHTPRNLCLALVMLILRLIALSELKQILIKYSINFLMFCEVGEVGELAECFQWKGEVQPGLNGN